MSITQIVNLPSRDQAPATFISNANAIWPQLNTYATEANTQAAAMNSIAAGGAMAIPYTFSTTTTDSDPGDGILRLDNATQNAATTIRTDLLGSDGSTWTSVLDTFDDSTNTVKGYIKLVKASDATKWLIFSVSALASPSGYKNITVAGVASSAASPFANSDSLVLQFTRVGDVGATGSTGASIPLTVIRSTRTSNTILAAADNAKLIDVTSGTFSQTFTAAATLGNGWYVWLCNSGTGVVTLDPNASELIDGLTSFPVYQNEVRLIQCDGAAFTSKVLHPFYLKTTSTITYIHPPGYLEVESDLVAGGGGGGSGARGAVASAQCAGGAAGGAPSRVIRKHRNIAAGTSITLTVGAAGTGGAAQTVNSTSGVTGVAGGNTTFGTLSTAYGGAAGVGGPSTGVAIGTSGSGSASAGVSSIASGSQNGGLPFNSSLLGSGTAGNQSNIGEGGGGCTTASGGNTEFGGASPCSNPAVAGAAAVATAAGSSMRGVSAASHGGTINDSTVLRQPKDAGLNGTYALGGGATAGADGGAVGTAGGTGSAAATDDVCGNPGAGGGVNATGAGGAGGAGGAPGGPGGGGGASANGANSGKGGDGAVGRAIIKGVV